MADIEQCRGRVEKSADALLQACKLAPQVLELHVRCGDTCMQALRYRDAAKVYRIGLDRQPDELMWKTRLAAALQHLGQLEAAVELYREVVARAPDEPIARFNLATALKRKHDFVGATQTYLEATCLAPDDAELRFSYAVMLLETAQYDLAIPQFETLIDRGKHVSEALNGLTYAHKKLEHGPEALDAAERLLLHTGPTDDSLVALSAAQVATQQYPAALKTCGDGLERNARSWPLLADRSIALSGLGARSEALALFNTDELLTVTDINSPRGFADLNAFNRALVTHLDGHPTLDFSGISLSCHEGATSDEVFTPPLGPVAKLREVILQAVRDYVQAITCADNFWCQQLPDVATLSISGWATRLRSQGYQHGHIHPGAWLSGVYYVSLPPEVGANQQDGWIEFGRAPFFYGDADQGATVPIQPAEGRLILFPPFFYHRTLKFESQHERVTIAFNLN